MGDQACSAPPGFEAFRRLVVADATLFVRLRPIMDRETLMRTVCELGTERGYRFDIADVEAAMREGQYAWLTHWLPVV